VKVPDGPATVSG